MKTNIHRLRLLVATAALAAFASFSFAGPGPQYWETLRQESQFKSLQTGEKVAYVCHQCKTISEIPIQSATHAMGLCKAGATVTCPSCKQTAKITKKEKRNDPASGTEVIYVNERGEECAFVVKVAASK